MEKRYDVFISYSTQDQKIVEGICGFLEREGYRCFVAYRDIPRGVVWATAVTDALDSSKMMVVVFSNEFNMSKQTDREIEIASENAMPILTYRVADAKMTGAKKYYLKNLHWIDAFPNPENYFGRLLDSVVKLIGPSKIVMDKVAQEEAERLAKEEAEWKSCEAAEKKLEREHIEAQRRTEQKKVNQLRFFGDSQSMPRKKLWLALGIMVVLVLLLVLLWPKKDTPSNHGTMEEPTLAELDSIAFQACQTVDDYRSYLNKYGHNALHYADAQRFIDEFMADSMAQAHKGLNSATNPTTLQTEENNKEGVTCKITFIQNDRKVGGLMEPQEVVKGTNTPLSSNMFTKKGYTFVGWNTESNGKGKDYSDKAVVNLKEDLRLYAQWKKNTEQENNSADNLLEDTANGHEYVDLGLPSGTLWATCNIGASKPEENGNYYAWGETSTKNTYNWDTYKYANGSYYELTKYCNNSFYGNNGFTDNLTTLQSSDDPATTNWGSGWQTPSKAQWDDLLGNTTNQWTVRNGVKGRLFTSKKNGHTLFLPAAGNRWDSEFSDAGLSGDYRSRSLNTDNPESAWVLILSSNYCHMYCNHYRTLGFSVRPVRQK